MDIAVIGAGRVGTAMAVLLSRAGHRIAAVSGREETEARAARYLPGVPVLALAEAVRAGDLAVIAVPDDELPSVVAAAAAEDAFGPGRWVAHVSGATGLGVLGPAHAAGARRLAVHPLQTFPDVDGAIARLPGSAIAVTADDEDGFALGERLARDLGGEPFRLADELRPLYHAAAVFASNYLVATSAVAAGLFGAAGVPDPARAMAPLQRATLENVERLGPGAALTGPAVRGDAGTVARNLEALSGAAPGAVPAYVAMCGVALDLAVASGRLAPERRAPVDEVLARWT
jgi:predicted short-subunit dehydrogenase-like oxidoreductase (DUF2520 family)